MAKKLADLEDRMQSPEVWSDKNLASKLGSEVKELKENLSKLSEWRTILDDAQVSLEVQDSDLISESYECLKALEKDISSFELRMMLSGEYDEADAILTVNAGAGGTDAQDWESMLLSM